jgi:hypothetical protein
MHESRAFITDVEKRGRADAAFLKRPYGGDASLLLRMGCLLQSARRSSYSFWCRPSGVMSSLDIRFVAVIHPQDDYG